MRLQKNTKTDKRASRAIMTGAFFVFFFRQKFQQARSFPDHLWREHKNLTIAIQLSKNRPLKNKGYYPLICIGDRITRQERGSPLPYPLPSPNQQPLLFFFSFSYDLISPPAAVISCTEMKQIWRWRGAKNKTKTTRRTQQQTKSFISWADCREIGYVSFSAVISLTRTIRFDKTHR